MVEDLTQMNTDLLFRTKGLNCVAQAWTINGTVYAVGQEGRAKIKITHYDTEETIRKKLVNSKPNNTHTSRGSGSQGGGDHSR